MSNEESEPWILKVPLKHSTFLCTDGPAAESKQCFCAENWFIDFVSKLINFANKSTIHLPGRRLCAQAALPQLGGVNALHC